MLFVSKAASSFFPVSKLQHDNAVLKEEVRLLQQQLENVGKANPDNGVGKSDKTNHDNGDSFSLSDLLSEISEYEHILGTLTFVYSLFWSLLTSFSLKVWIKIGEGLAAMLLSF